MNKSSKAFFDGKEVNLNLAGKPYLDSQRSRRNQISYAVQRPVIRSQQVRRMLCTGSGMMWLLDQMADSELPDIRTGLQPESLVDSDSQTLAARDIRSTDCSCYGKPSYRISNLAIQMLLST